ncbi:hypothetical protein EVAR_12357_1 [Eumeta japonica]|uniref:Uncharacterized protein n=1 Tax=Eumeta variegata TaxID=151549 RepID=A0A4C1WYY0_EUMVA|nr:hypothetical protein EVAR_12357_1 [Eumeta japonica]
MYADDSITKRNRCISECSRQIIKFNKTQIMHAHTLNCVTNLISDVISRRLRRLYAAVSENVTLLKGENVPSMIRLDVIGPAAAIRRAGARRGRPP